eukprot:SAG22_NODE_1103_length_5558_cov_1.611650_2_plen_255_part_00
MWSPGRSCTQARARARAHTHTHSHTKHVRKERRLCTRAMDAHAGLTTVGRAAHHDVNPALIRVRAGRQRIPGLHKQQQDAPILEVRYRWDAVVDMPTLAGGEQLGPSPSELRENACRRSGTVVHFHANRGWASRDAPMRVRGIHTLIQQAAWEDGRECSDVCALLGNRYQLRFGNPIDGEFWLVLRDGCLPLHCPEAVLGRTIRPRRTPCAGTVVAPLERHLSSKYCRKQTTLLHEFGNMTGDLCALRVVTKQP